jgi:hypothetical protein
LFFGWPPGRIARSAARIRGSHGRTGPGREVALACTFSAPPPDSLLDAARAVQTEVDAARVTLFFENPFRELKSSNLQFVLITQLFLNETSQIHQSRYLKG